MKPKAMKSFLEEFLEFQGARTETQGEQILEVRAPRKLAQRLGSARLRLAFHIKGLEADAASELATVGNPVFDRILELAREAGTCGQRFLPLAARPRTAPSPSEYLGTKGMPAGGEKPAPVYSPFYFFLFRAEFSLEEIPDSLEIIPLDGVSMESPAQTPELGEYWEGLERTPAPEREVEPAFPVPEEAVSEALRVLERRLRKRVGRLRRMAQEALDRETESIGQYYQQLIDETRNAGRRWTLPPGGKEERIRLLQLDWKRRIEEAQANWAPKIEVSLAGVAAAQRPRLRYDLGAAKGGRKKGPAQGRRGRKLYWDETDKRFLEPPSGNGAGGRRE